MARAYAGTVMLEGTILPKDAARPPARNVRAPDITAAAVFSEMRPSHRKWLQGCVLRECWFEPTFHKHAGKPVQRRADSRRRSGPL